MTLRNWLAAGGLAFLLGALWFSYHRGYASADAEWQLRWEKRDAADATAQAEAQEAARVEERRRIEEAERVRANAAKQLEDAQSRADAGSAANSRLQQQLTKLQARLGTATSNSAAVQRSASATRAAMVLSDLYGSCSDERRTLAAGLDQSRIRGLACEAQYQSLSNKK